MSKCFLVAEVPISHLFHLLITFVVPVVDLLEDGEVWIDK